MYDVRTFINEAKPKNKKKKKSKSKHFRVTTSTCIYIARHTQNTPSFNKIKK